MIGIGCEVGVEPIISACPLREVKCIPIQEMAAGCDTVDGGEYLVDGVRRLYARNIICKFR